mmetsp:Transcript_77300/g.224255  ORF Transcript_77300/g.224255 Transcript_77300/m.224255 type:complete len:397 (-) Transcript_77300:243-1433(-)
MSPKGPHFVLGLRSPRLGMPQALDDRGVSVGNLLRRRALLLLQQSDHPLGVREPARRRNDLGISLISGAITLCDLALQLRALILQLGELRFRARCALEERALVALRLRFDPHHGRLRLRHPRLDLAQLHVALETPALQVRDALSGGSMLGLSSVRFGGGVAVGHRSALRLLGLADELVDSSRPAVRSLLRGLRPPRSDLALRPPCALLLGHGGALLLQRLLRLLRGALDGLHLSVEPRNLGLFRREPGSGRLGSRPRGLQLSGQTCGAHLCNLHLVVGVGESVLALSSGRFHLLYGHDAVARIDGAPQRGELRKAEAVHGILQLLHRRPLGRELVAELRFPGLGALKLGAAVLERPGRGRRARRGRGGAHCGRHREALLGQSAAKSHSDVPPTGGA